MQTFLITLGSVPDVRRFVDAATRYSCEIDVRSGRYLVDAKSIMGLFSLELQRPIQVEFHGSDEDGAAFAQDIAPLLTPAEER